MDSKELQANELMIGNWVFDSLGNPFMVDGLQIMKMDVNGHNDGLKAIPLTPEIISKIEFEHWGNRAENWSCGIEMQAGVYCFWASLWDYSDYAGTANLREVEYVHQLQNLYFALTGNPLQITL